MNSSKASILLSCGRGSETVSVQDPDWVNLAFSWDQGLLNSNPFTSRARPPQSQLTAVDSVYWYMNSIKLQRPPHFTMQILQHVTATCWPIYKQEWIHSSCKKCWDAKYCLFNVKSFYVLYVKWRNENCCLQRCLPRESATNTWWGMEGGQG